jgi:hypothetical protein
VGVGRLDLAQHEPLVRQWISKDGYLAHLARMPDEEIDQMLGQMKLNFRAQREFRQVSTPSTLWAAQACGRAAFSWLGVAGVAPALVTTRPSTTTGSEGAAGPRPRPRRLGRPS